MMTSLESTPVAGSRDGGTLSVPPKRSTRPLRYIRKKGKNSISTSSFAGMERAAVVTSMFPGAWN
ncbi:hypothetical protein IEQ34_010527 [Dendrobium chrysotoxum]|uniref:Uncharacterized protein n=1 Tax=Dendrobium chrysotoxum TaxID=161865 RepID=A0AAV7GVQ7_DENCH|nr:hypothetical protein IEQ34_010527 [Dendrobium chrysotoxum]